MNLRQAALALDRSIASIQASAAADKQELIDKTLAQYRAYVLRKGTGAGATRATVESIDADSGSAERGCTRGASDCAGASESFAMDRASVRRLDVDGRFHVEITPISKATVNEYLGSEIPGFQTLGLDPDRKYKLLRHPDELKKAASTFNNIPLLSKHVPVSAAKPEKELVVGSTGTDAVFDSPFLKNSLVVWDDKFIKRIVSGEQKELSCAYRYEPDMVPGTYGGLPYDGIMRDIIGNHVALVEEGRAGPDVVVGDQAIQTNANSGVPAGGKQERKMAKNEGMKDPALDAASELKSFLKGKMSEDDYKKACDMMPDAGSAEDEDEDEDDKKAKDAEADPQEEDKRKDDPEAEDAEEEFDDEASNKKKLVAVGAKGKDKKAKDKKAADDAPEQQDVEKTKAAMDSAIRAAVNGALERSSAARRAERIVQPWVGALDGDYRSEEDVFAAALKVMGVGVKGVHPSAYRAILEAQPKPNSRGKSATTTVMASDSKTMSDYNTMFPDAARINVA